MHHACRFVIRVPVSNGIKTVPKSRPAGRIILYASRTNVLILSADCTVVIRSEYISTASVFSSWAGTDALTSACIHAGASAAAERAGHPKANTHSTAIRAVALVSSVSRARCHWLHNDLFFIARPHVLEKSSE